MSNHFHLSIVHQSIDKKRRQSGPAKFALNNILGYRLANRNIGSVILALLTAFIGVLAAGNSSPCLAWQSESPPPISGAANDAQVDSDVTAATWIAKLGDVDPDVRGQAETALLDLGERAIESVQANLQSSDNEIRLHCERLMVELKKLSSARKRAEFLQADPDDEEDFGFASWPTFSKAAGANQSARQLYLSVDEHLGELFELLNRDHCPDLRLKAKELTTYAEDGQPQSALLTGFVLAHLVAQEKQPTEQLSSVARKEALTFILRPSFTESWQESELGNETRQLVSSWLSSLNVDPSKFTRNDFRVAYQYKLTEFIKNQTANWNGFTNASKRRWLECAANLLPPQDVSLLVDKMEDDHVLLTSRKKSDTSVKLEIQVRDMAIFATIKLNDWPMEEFGLVETTSNFDYSNEIVMGFENNEMRLRALKHIETHEDLNKHDSAGDLESESESDRQPSSNKQ